MGVRKARVSAPSVATHERLRKASNLLSSPAVAGVKRKLTDDLDSEAISAYIKKANALDCKRIAKQFTDGNTYDGKSKFLGADARPYAFEITYDDGDSETMTLEEVQQYVQLSPEEDAERVLKDLWRCEDMATTTTPIEDLLLMVPAYGKTPGSRLWQELQWVLSNMQGSKLGDLFEQLLGLPATLLQTQALRHKKVKLSTVNEQAEPVVETRVQAYTAVEFKSSSIIARILIEFLGQGIFLEGVVADENMTDLDEAFSCVDTASQRSCELRSGEKLSISFTKARDLASKCKLKSKADVHKFLDMVKDVQPSALNAYLSRFEVEAQGADELAVKRCLEHFGRSAPALSEDQTYELGSRAFRVKLGKATTKSGTARDYFRRAGTVHTSAYCIHGLGSMTGAEDDGKSVVFISAELEAALQRWSCVQGVAQSARWQYQAKTKSVVVWLLVRVTSPLRELEGTEVDAWMDSVVALDGPKEPMQAAVAGVLKGIRQDWASFKAELDFDAEGAVETAALRRRRAAELAARRASDLDKMRQAVASLERRRSTKRAQAMEQRERRLDAEKFLEDCKRTSPHHSGNLPGMLNLEPGSWNRCMLEKEHIRRQEDAMWNEVNELGVKLKRKKLEIVEAEKANEEGEGEPEVKVNREMSPPEFQRILDVVEKHGPAAQPTDETTPQIDFAGRVAYELRPYQRRAVQWMLAEERTPGGLARHAWVPLPAPSADPERCPTGVAARAHAITGRVAAGPRGDVAQECDASSVRWPAPDLAGGFLCADMGMGKTACAIATIVLGDQPDRAGFAVRAAKGACQRSVLGGTLIVAALSIVGQWKRELAAAVKGTPLRVHQYYGDARIRNLAALAQYDVVITTPGIIATRDPALLGIEWHRIIVDEAHKDTGKLLEGHRCVLHGRRRWCLTGTPLGASLRSLQNQLAFLGDGDLCTSAGQFLERQLLYHQLRKCMFRVTKEGTAVDGRTNLQLPPLQQSVVEVKFTEKELENYRLLQAHARKEVNEVRFGCGNNRAQMLKISSLLAPLRQACAGCTVPSPADEATTLKFAAKSTAVIQAITATQKSDPSAKILIFSNFTGALEEVKALLPGCGLNYRMLQGKMTLKQREDAINAFQFDPPTTIFLLTARAGAVGITLTSASHVFLMEPALDTSLELQAINRSHRLGQSKPVMVKRFTVSAHVEGAIRRQVAQRAGDSTTAGMVGIGRNVRRLPSARSRPCVAYPPPDRGPASTSAFL
ncbi:hypothetical protein CYMTET_29182 [Cymbomonas tetramitiformis]|uniref:Uncharacterized protein n=1 Tax=Cymbomonas tetramitiformis TaxID=36881 RepID=A0AAE0FLT0_9CHLO|nr:hypothetical protein CYMTET_29182 [Cymbomonas tetramitiformis]